MKRDEPWTLEPNFKVWTDRDTGLRCCIIRAGLGHLCGYVRLPAGKIARKFRKYGRVVVKSSFGAFGRPISNHHLLKNLSVHGGVTWANSLENYRVRRGLWVGFDCAHAFDFIPEMVKFSPSVSSHCRGDQYRDIAYVTAQCESLAKQLKELIDG